MNHELPRQIFEKSSYKKFQEHLFSGRQGVPGSQTRGAIRRFSPFFARA